MKDFAVQDSYMYMYIFKKNNNHLIEITNIKNVDIDIEY